MQVWPCPSATMSACECCLGIIVWLYWLLPQQDMVLRVSKRQLWLPEEWTRGVEGVRFLFLDGSLKGAGVGCSGWVLWSNIWLKWLNVCMVWLYVWL